MTLSQAAPVAEVMRMAYLDRKEGMVEVEHSHGAPEIFFFRGGEIFLDRDHPAARHLAPLLAKPETRPAAMPEIQRAMTTLAHDLVRDRKSAARFHDRLDGAVELAGPLPTVLVVMEIAVHGLNETELIERLGGEDQCYQSSNETPALEQLPGLEPDMAQVLVGLVQPASVGDLLRGAPTDRLSMLRGLSKLRAVGLIVEEGGRIEDRPDEEILSPKLLRHFQERVAENLKTDPLTLDSPEHRRRVADLLGNLGKLNHYKLLGVEPKVSEDEVLRAYNRLARLVHPSHAHKLGFEGREDAVKMLFEQATEAYLVLSDPRRRASYNMIVGIQLTTEVDADKRDSEKKRMARQHYIRASQCLSEMDYSLAVDLLKEAARLDPKAQYFARLGQAQSKNPNWQRHAIESYRRAVELSPEDAGIRLGYAEALETMTRTSEAKQQYREALRLMPDNAAALSALERLR